MLYSPVTALGKVVLMARHEVILHCVTAILMTVVLVVVREATEHTVHGLKKGELVRGVTLP